MVALVWRSYCRCAEITDRLLQMLTTFDQHGQCPCKEGRKSSEKKPTKDIWAWGERGERDSPRSIITRQRGGSIFNPGPFMWVGYVTVQIKFLPQEY